MVALLADRAQGELIEDRQHLLPLPRGDRAATIFPVAQECGAMPSSRASCVGRMPARTRTSFN